MSYQYWLGFYSVPQSAGDAREPPVCFLVLVRSLVRGSSWPFHFIVSISASQYLNVQPNKQSYSGTEIAACRNMVSCAEYCLWEPSCYSVDWNSLDNKCFAHYKAKSAQKAQCPCTRFKKIKSCKPVCK